MVWILSFFSILLLSLDFWILWMQMKIMHIAIMQNIQSQSRILFLCRDGVCLFLEIGCSLLDGMSFCVSVLFDLLLLCFAECRNYEKNWQLVRVFSWEKQNFANSVSNAHMMYVSKNFRLKVVCCCVLILFTYSFLRIPSFGLRLKLTVWLRKKQVISRNKQIETDVVDAFSV
jgi:hypothetical protein